MGVTIYRHAFRRHNRASMITTATSSATAAQPAPARAKHAAARARAAAAVKREPGSGHIARNRQSVGDGGRRLNLGDAGEG